LYELMARLTWVDYSALVAVLWGFYVGYKGGLFPEILRIGVYLVTVIVTLRFRAPLADYLTLKTFLNSFVAGAAALTVLLAGVFFLLKLVTLLVLKLLKIGTGGFFYRFLGGLFGACRWIVLLSLIFMLLDNSPLTPLAADIHRRSVVGPKLSRIAPILFDFLSSLSPQLAVRAKKTL